ncbi:MAG: hypothetical protein M3161_02995 [Actinomycetota bacterium]|nr:hypothetical protein [Actinomycetota bacterium]
MRTLRSSRRAWIVGAVSAAVSVILLASPAHAAFPGDNGRIVFSSFAGSSRIFTMDASGRDLTSVLASGADPQWSPSGEEVVFTDQTVGTAATALFTMRADGSHVRRLTPDGLDAFEPAWSPDGQWVAFTVMTPEEMEDLYVIRRDGTKLRQLTSLPGNEFMAAWSPDGEEIVFCRDLFPALRSDVYAIAPDGSGLRAVTDSFLEPEYSPSWSPDGDRLVFERYELGSSAADLFSVRSDGTGEERITSTPWDEQWPSYSPDGKRVLFSSDKDGDWDIYTQHVDGTQQRKLTNNSSDERVADWQSK